MRLNGFIILSKAVSKGGYWFKVKADVNIKPEEYYKYFEDLIFAPNAEIEPITAFRDSF